MCTVGECFEPIKTYDWLLKETDLKDDQLAELICEYINTHKYFINQTIPFTVSFDQAVFSWYENVYKPMLSAIYATGLLYTVSSSRTYKDIIKKVSDIHYIRNADLTAPYSTYVDVCKQILFTETKGFWLVKIRAYLLA